MKKHKIGTMATVVIFAVLIVSGCSSTKGYLLNRMRDSADIINVTVGRGYGVSARVSALHAGVGFIEDYAGLMGGDFSLSDSKGCRFTVDPLIAFPYLEWKEGWGYYWDSFDGWDTDSVANQRRKSFKMIGICPFIAVPTEHSKAPSVLPLSQIDVAAGLFVSFRFGVNFTEILDLVFGIAGIDILGDDIGPVKYSSHEEKMKIGYEEKLKKDPNDLNSLHWLGVYYQRHMDFKESRRYFEMCLKVDPKSTSEHIFFQRALIYLALNYQRGGEVDAAKSCYNKFIKTNPDFKNDFVLLNCRNQYLRNLKK